MQSERHRDDDKAARPPVEPARLPDFSEMLALSPLMANPLAAMALGFGIANQMADMFFSAFQGVMEQAGRTGGPAETAAAPADIVSPRQPVDAQSDTPRPAMPTSDKEKSGRASAVNMQVLVAARARRKAVKGPQAAAVENVGSIGARAAPSKPSAREALGADVDLKRISGIGPKLEKVLKDMGVAGLAEVAAWSDADIGRFDKQLGFNGRITRDDWVGQAQALLK